jgi:transposase
MKKQYRDPSPDQLLLLPPSLRDWLPEGHLANFVVEIVTELDIGPIERAIQAKDPRGTRPYDPRMMVALLVYAYASGVFSSRRIARSCIENVAFRVVSRNQQPFFTSIAEFRRVHHPALSALFVEVVRLCREAGLMKGRDVHLDGTKVQANASKHKAMSYAGMKQAEERLKKEIEELLARAEQADRDDDARLGEGKDEDDGVDPEVKRRETRLAWIRRKRAELEEEAKRARAAELREQAAEQRRRAEDEVKDADARRRRTNAAKSEAKAAQLVPEPPASPPADAMPEHTPANEPDGTPKPEAQRNFTDGDSRIMLGKKGAYEQCYNGQVVVDESSHVIVAEGLSNQAPDAEHAAPMLARTAANLGHVPATFTADAGYVSQDNVRVCLHAGTTPYFAVDRARRSWPPPKVAEGAPPRNATTKEWMAWMLHTEQGQRQMRKRKSTVELVFGCIKQAMGFRQFLLRGLAKVRAEWSLVCLAYNVRKLHAARA